MSSSRQQALINLVGADDGNDMRTRSSNENNNDNEGDEAEPAAGPAPKKDTKPKDPAWEHATVTGQKNSPNYSSTCDYVYGGILDQCSTIYQAQNTRLLAKASV